MKLRLKGHLVTMSALMLVVSLLAACGTTTQQYSSSHRIIVGRCSQQPWPITKRLTTGPSLSQSVYFISGTHLYALDAGNGAVRWCMYASYADTPLATLANAASLLGMEGPPPLPDGFTGLTVSNGTIYACSLNGSTYAFQSASGALLWQHDTGFDNTSTGALRWQYDTGGRVYVDPVAAADTVFFGAGNDGPTLYAVNARNGKLLWHNSMPVQSVQSSLAVANGVLYVGSRNFLYALNPHNGAILWRRQVATPFTPLIVNGIIYIASGSAGMYALNASDGTLRWHNALNPMRAGETTRPLLMNGEVYVGTIDVGVSPSKAFIHALDASSGTEDWYASVNWNVSTIGIAA